MRGATAAAVFSTLIACAACEAEFSLNGATVQRRAAEALSEELRRPIRPGEILPNSRAGVCNSDADARAAGATCWNFWLVDDAGMKLAGYEGWFKADRRTYRLIEVIPDQRPPVTPRGAMKVRGGGRL